MTTSQVQAYLTRIGLAFPLAPTLAHLRDLQKQHLLHVPFENLDIHLGQRIVLDEGRLFEKIVERRRGGFCYEVNGLFARLLQTLGYSVRLLTARVYDEQKGYGPPFDHLTLCVQLGADEYLVDVGFGNLTLYPLLITDGRVQEDPLGTYIIEQFDEFTFGVGRIDPTGSVQPQYRFDRRPRQWKDFERMCQYHQTSPDSHFTQQPMITLPSETGRLTLSAYKLKRTQQGTSYEEQLSTKLPFGEWVRRYFGITVEGEFKI